MIDIGLHMCWWMCLFGGFVWVSFIWVDICWRICVVVFDIVDIGVDVSSVGLIFGGICGWDLLVDVCC